VDALPQNHKEELLLFLATKLRAQTGDLPTPREFSRDQLQRWIAEDEAGYARFLNQP
jgi:hypothetical protein